MSVAVICSDEGQIQILGQVHGRYVTLIVWREGNDREQSVPDSETWALASRSHYSAYLIPVGGAGIRNVNFLHTSNKLDDKLFATDDY